MSLYYEAAKVLEDVADGTKSLKQRVYNDKSLKSAPGAVFALVSETSKWSPILSDVIDESGLLGLERKLTPALSLVLVHDLLLSKKGLSASKKHPLFDLINKHKARLNSELTRIRIRKGARTIDVLRDQLAASTNGEDGSVRSFHPRWVRINAVKNTLSECLAESFKDYEEQSSLEALRAFGSKGFYVDGNIPNLIAVHSSVDLTKSQAYRSGHIILQDKASCFPAYLLDPATIPGNIIDGCAAPGNKTTHLAAILAENIKREGMQQASITACERAKDRAQTLKTMVHRAGASNIVTTLAGQDFLALDPLASKWSNTTGILLDPSCSGSGIVGRDAESSIKVTFPGSCPAPTQPPSKKRKRNGQPKPEAAPPLEPAEEDEQEPEATPASSEALQARLRSLAAFQQHIVEHAMRFPAARRITYSTCSVHGAENEGVAARVLASDVAQKQGWRVMRREEQMEGLRKWGRRGDVEECRAVMGEGGKAEELAEACIRAAKGTDEGTMGFFVVGFVRDDVGDDDDGGGDWDGFSD